VFLKELLELNLLSDDQTSRDHTFEHAVPGWVFCKLYAISSAPPPRFHLPLNNKTVFEKWIQCWYNSQKQFLKEYDDTIYACFSTQQMVREILYIKSTKVYALYMYMI
jgi:hypothetical protein